MNIITRIKRGYQDIKSRVKTFVKGNTIIAVDIANRGCTYVYKKGRKSLLGVVTELASDVTYSYEEVEPFTVAIKKLKKDDLLDSEDIRTVSIPSRYWRDDDFKE